MSMESNKNQTPDVCQLDAAPCSGFNEGFNYSDVICPQDDGWINLFFGDHAIAIINNCELADIVRGHIPSRRIPNATDQTPL